MKESFITLITYLVSKALSWLIDLEGWVTAFNVENF